MSLKNGETISTGQKVRYGDSPNTCQQHCLTNGEKDVCGKGELCCNVIQDETNQNFNLVFAI